ncbi:helix-turn-helix transcriptional regulator [Corallococcus sp. ZKHCc1 1396]|uniref:Helix-turn-helix transcriptional regulator n=1 Tax=Corallococcus soli TaxID=2710757 RepID=A0ABR9PTP7_9BACT|nr:TetR/AcrR family transcriptional regulator [Corallococcus sp. BB11-1]MBE4751244.1 helix-turn-helix transcriptional regulator [Corallococcus soli]MCY1033038.1 helix-turn-helix domain containing protein [Corallococcus sp. BB11-1]
MARTRAFDETVAVRAALGVFWSRGYEATSLSDLESATGLNRSSLYQAFESKRALFSRAITLYLQEVIAPRLVVFAAGTPGLEQVTAYFESLATTMGTAPPTLTRRGCLLVNTATELAPHDAEAHRAVEDYRALLSGHLTRALEGAARAGVMPRKAVARRVELLVGAVIGVLVTARVDPSAAAKLARAAASEVAGWAE